MSFQSRLVALAESIAADIKRLDSRIDAAGSGAMVDGGGPTTNHSGNMKIDFGGVS